MRDTTVFDFNTRTDHISGVDVEQIIQMGEVKCFPENDTNALYTFLVLEETEQQKVESNKIQYSFVVN